jgi:hypothetical protein
MIGNPTALGAKAGINPFAGAERFPAMQAKLGAGLENFD